MRYGCCVLISVVTLAAVPLMANAAVRITEFMSEGQGDLTSGNGGRRQREFFEITNLSNTPVDVSTWSYNDDNANDPQNFGPALGTMLPFESVIFTQMSVDAFRTHWALPASVRIFSYAQLSNLGNSDTINIYNSFTQNASTLVDSFQYVNDPANLLIRGSGVSRNRPRDFTTDNQYPNSQWESSFVGDQNQSRFVPEDITFPGFTDPAVFRDLANPGFYVPETSAAVWAMPVLAGVARRRRV